MDAQRHNKHYRARTRERQGRRRKDDDDDDDNNNDTNNVITERRPENGDGRDVIMIIIRIMVT